MKIRIWKMNDCDWVAAETLDGAMKCLCEMFSELLPDGKVPPDFIEEYCDDPFELADEAYDKLTFVDAEPGSDEEKDPKNKRTFRQELQRRIDAGEKFPQFFATSEY